jgi:hypothetical protein
MDWKKCIPISVMVLGCVFMTGCPTWVSTPDKQFKDTEWGAVLITPLENPDKRNGYGYEGFLLSVNNMTDYDIQIIWSKTLYVYGGETHGLFYDSGEYYDEAYTPKPPDIVFSHTFNVKKIYPVRLLGHNDKKTKWWKDIMPAGENGVYLTVVNKIGHETNTKITVDLEKVEKGSTIPSQVVQPPAETPTARTPPAETPTAETPSPQTSTRDDKVMQGTPGPGEGPGWISTPDKKFVDTEYGAVLIIPQENPDKRHGYGYEGFLLSVNNMTDNDIQIIWSKTLYIHDGETNGLFYFGGDDYDEVNTPKPPDIVFKRTFSKRTVYPLRLIEHNHGTGEWRTNIMPAGENGVYLTVVSEGREINTKITVDLHQKGSVVPHQVVQPPAETPTAETPTAGTPPAGTPGTGEDCFLWGLLVMDLTHETRNELHLDTLGAIVERVTPGSAADRAGLHRGDIIIAVGDIPMKSAADVARALSRAPHGYGQETSVLLWSPMPGGARYRFLKSP